MAFGTKAQFDAVRELAFGGISGAYAPVGAPLTDHARIVRISNSTNAEIYFSIDGTTNHIRMAVNGFVLFDFSTNRIQNDGLFLSVGTQFYAKQVSGAPTSGSVWVEVVSAIGGV